ncbi:Ras GTPase, partial [Cryomyces antarcticus]
MLVGNKSDRVTEREVSTQEGSALARELNCEFVEASAKNCVNVERAFYDVVRQLRRQRPQSVRSSDRRGGGLGGYTNAFGREKDRIPEKGRRRKEKKSRYA